MKILSMNQVKPEPLNAALFTGEVSRQPLAPDSREFTVTIVNFPKGVRNKFHTHANEQILIVTKGKGFIATETERRQLAVGDVVVIPPGENHWHGASDDSDFAHITVQRAGLVTQQNEK